MSPRKQGHTGWSKKHLRLFESGPQLANVSWSRSSKNGYDSCAFTDDMTTANGLFGLPMFSKMLFRVTT